MECVVDLPCFGDVLLICDGGEDLDDIERSLTFRDEFWVGNEAFEISGF